MLCMLYSVLFDRSSITGIELGCGLMQCYSSLDCYHSYQSPAILFLHHLWIPICVTHVFSVFIYSWYTNATVAWKRSREVVSMEIVPHLSVTQQSFCNGVKLCPKDATAALPLCVYMPFSWIQFLFQVFEAKSIQCTALIFWHFSFTIDIYIAKVFTREINFVS